MSLLSTCTRVSAKPRPTRGAPSFTHSDRPLRPEAPSPAATIDTHSNHGLDDALTYTYRKNSCVASSAQLPHNNSPGTCERRRWCVMVISGGVRHSQHQ